MGLIQPYKLQNLPDEELFTAFKKGDEQAFDFLLGRHQKPLYNFLYRTLGNLEAAEEALQEVFLRVIRSADEYRPSAKFTTWLYTIARNFCIDYGRKQRFRRHLSLDTKEDDDAEPLQNSFAAHEASADEQVSAQQLEKILYTILDELAPEQKEVFLLRETQGLQFDEIAKMTKVSVNTVKSRMRYALMAIQKKFEEYGVVKNWL
jgi:RNA polymerase sigma-70 factor (ECF subfamily)